MPTKAEAQPALTMFVTGYCHLCTEMERELVRWQQRLGFRFELKDIDESPELDQAYGERVPVLMLGDTEVCAGRLDPARLQQVLAALN